MTKAGAVFAGPRLFEWMAKYDDRIVFAWADTDCGAYCAIPFRSVSLALMEISNNRMKSHKKKKADKKFRPIKPFH